MTVSEPRHDRPTLLGPRAGVLMAVTGAASLFATYWDDAWHTDIGRDSALAPPHLALYGAVALAGLVVLSWGLRALAATGSVTAVLRQPPLLLAGLGGSAILVSAPIDAAWHAAYGRDAVLWSPPHMLAVLGSTALTVGVLAGLARSRRRLARAGVGALLLGSLAVSVMEYETDVAQFAETLYLPVLLASALLAALLIGWLAPAPAPVAVSVGLYVAFRLLTTGALAGLGRSAPDLPLAVAGLAVVDLRWRSEWSRYLAAAAAISALAWAAAAVDLASEPASAIAPVALPVLTAFAASVLSPRRGEKVAAAALVLGLVGAGAVLLAGPAPAALAHDPGQGRTTTRVQLSTTSDGHGGLSATLSMADCRAVTPERIVARRAGREILAPLTAGSSGTASTPPGLRSGAQVQGVGCRFSGEIRVPDGGRWFVYVELRRDNRALEAWFPARADRPGTQGETRPLYEPAGTAGTSQAQVLSGLALYLLGAGLIAVAVAEARRVGLR